MTKQDFIAPYHRLCTRFKLEPSDEQAKVWFARFGHQELTVWERAVDALVAEMRPPLLDHVLKAVDAAQAQRRAAVMAKERMEAERFFAGKIPLVRWADPREGAYNAFRMSLITGNLGGAVRDQRSCSQRHAEELRAWLLNEQQTDWASKQPMGDCGRHQVPHSLLQCLIDEQRYWELRVQGKTEQDAKEAVTGVSA